MPVPRVRGLPDFGRCAVLGILNVTPDSFSDGGAFVNPEAAVAHGLAMLADGADIVDVGGESTRPGAARVPADEELRRVIPVVRELAAAGALLSIDTMRAEVAQAALDSGAALVNDVSGGLADAAMAGLVAHAGAPYVLMHWRGHSDSMQQRVQYHDVMADVVAELRSRLDTVLACGVDPEQIILDPGLGFAKTAAHNWTLLAHLDALATLGHPLLISASRKSFLGTLLAGPDGEQRTVDQRDDATTAISALAAMAGVWGIRVHQVRPAADAVRVATAITAARVITSQTPGQ